MTDTKPKPFLRLKLLCGCGARLFVELPQEPKRAFGMEELPKDVIKLGVAWSSAHAAHHKEPAK